jgi:hypothetical protein
MNQENEPCDERKMNYDEVPHQRREKNELRGEACDGR